ncbi:MAG: hypothetical protein ABSB52_09205 [Acidimicrobiales bacterium]|jgi:hypothetical protein
MNAYVEAGYVVVLGTLSIYGSTLVARERAARRRLGVPAGPQGRDVPGKAQQESGDVPVPGPGGSEEHDRGPVP